MADPQDIPMSVKMNDKCFPDIERLARGERADEQQILELLDFIDARYDCADFRMVCVIRSLYCYTHLLSSATSERMRQTVLNFKYGMDEPGQDSMCYWSENHQLLFSVCEYLAGQLYPDDIFTNNGMSGRQHREKAGLAIHRWLERRFQFGFVEFHSNTYYEEDVAPLSLLIDFGDEPTLVQEATILMDLMMLDIALHSFQGYLAATSGRCYEAQKQDPARQDVSDIIQKAFGFPLVERYDYTRLSAEFLLNTKYQLPRVIREIAHCSDAAEIKTSFGLDLDEVKRSFAGAPRIDDAGMFLWSMEAFTNVESVDLTMDMFRSWKLRSNIFLQDLKTLDIPVVRHLRLLPLLVRLLNPVTQGIAIQRSNSYTYKTRSYMLSTSQKYHPQEFGDQQHIWQATLDGGVSVFTTHPAAAVFDDNARNFSPSYWVGNGINPHAAQHRNVSLVLYDLRVRKGLLEKERLLLSHAYFPFDKFEQTDLSSETACFGQVGDAYIGLLSTSPLVRKGDSELVQQGVVTGWAAVLGSVDSDGSFADFVAAVQGCRLELQGDQLVFVGDDTLELRFNKDFTVNGEVVDTDYPRIDCPYVSAERLPDEFHVRYGARELHLDFRNLARVQR